MNDNHVISFVEALKSVPVRFLVLIGKLLSVKVLVLVGAFYLVADKIVVGWNAVVLFLFTALIVIFGREAIKFIEALKGLK